MVHEIDSADEKQEEHARLHQEQGGRIVFT